MRIGFFHDTVIVAAQDKRYYSLSMNYEVWQRYLNYFDEVIVCSRVRKEVNLDYGKYRISSGDKVSFELNEIYKSPLQLFTDKKNITRPIKKVVDKVDGCIIRLPSIIGILTIQECIKQKKPYLVEVVGCCWDSLWNYGNIQGKGLAPIMYLLNKYYIKRSAYVLYVSDEFLQSRYPTRGISIGCSDVNIKIEGMEVLNKRLEKIKNMDMQKPIYLGLIGSLNVNYKGHYTAIKAIKELQSDGYDVRLKCLGGGDSERWKKISENLGIEGKIEFCGVLPAGEQVLRWMDEIDIFIIPSLQEGLPRALVEAMSRGCPAIGSRVGGIPELLPKEMIIERKNHKGLASIIIKLIKNNEEMIKIANLSFNTAKRYLKSELDIKRMELLEKFRGSI